MNVTGFGDDDNDTFVGKENQSNNIYTMREIPWLDWTTVLAVRRIILYVVWALGIPGNILSAIVWMRRHVASENPSAIYLAVLAINDLAYLLITLLCRFGCDAGNCTCEYTWLCCFLSSSKWSTSFLEPLLVLSFSVVRLIAIRRPLHVCRTTRFILIN